MVTPVNHSKSPVVDQVKQGLLKGHKVSNWEKFKTGLYNNRKAIMVALLIASIIVASVGLGFAVTAALGATALLGVTGSVTGSVSLLSLTPSIAGTLTVSATLTAAVKTIIWGGITFLGGALMTFGSAGFLAGTSIQRKTA